MHKAIDIFPDFRADGAGGLQDQVYCGVMIEVVEESAGRLSASEGNVRRTDPHSDRFRSTGKMTNMLEYDLQGGQVGGGLTIKIR